ncbi:MAG TPA: sigma-70 family RNA polymerase sigma factor [Chitinophagaceae bacterium]|nr:sigma-70 family RNA polymerase sigma factor [Chitinophagaceae bacterium]
MTQQLNLLHAECRSYAQKLTQNKTLADDLVQEAMTRYYTGDVNAIGNKHGYIKKTIHNLFINNIRTEKRHRVFTSHTLKTTAVSASPAFRFETETELEQLFNLIASVLTPHERAVFILKKGFEKEYEWIERMFGISYDNCRQLLHRAKSKLRRKTDAPACTDGKELYNMFLKASRNGGINELVSYLKQDIAIMN